MGTIMKESFSPTGVSLSSVMSALKQLEGIESDTFERSDESIVISGLAAITIMEHYPPSMFDKDEHELIVRATKKLAELKS